MSEKLKVGTFVRLALDDGTFGYGRILATPYVAFYNFNTKEPSSDLAAIEAAEVLFTVGVRRRGLDGWVNIGTKPLAGEVAKPVVQFMQDLVDYRKCTIFDSAGMERRAAPEECVGIERAAAWEANGIEGRLLDRFAGRSNQAEMRKRVRLK